MTLGNGDSLIIFPKCGHYSKANKDATEREAFTTGGSYRLKEYTELKDNRKQKCLFTHKL